jgi:hypothetical protein
MWAYLALAAAQLVGGYQQGELIRQNGDLQASINNMNAKYSDIDAYNAETAGISESARYATVIDATIAKQRTAYASDNVDVNYGTAAEVQADSKLTGFLNTLELQRQGRERALGYTVQGMNTRLGGQMTQLQSQMDAAAAEGKGVMGAISTGISGYSRSLSTGKGTTSKSGTNTAPTWSDSGNSSAQQPSWFFGTDPRPHSQASLFS